jgi:threonylcarbamoyladenosine tRNA methylthiotransferase MtaB
MGKGRRNFGWGKSSRHSLVCNFLDHGTMKKFVVKTLGCKANSADGQLLEVGLRARGFTSTHELDEADLVIINSCTVTNEADRQSQKMVRDIHKRHPKAKIVYTGCAAEVNPKQALLIAGVSAVLGNQNKNEAANLIDTFFKEESLVPVTLGTVTDYEELRSKHPMDREWPLPDASFSDMINLGTESSTFRTRAFIKIQEGCNSFCTYCIIPYGRGPSRSLPIVTIVSEIKKLVEHGIREVILTGINIGDYGIDFSGKLQIDELIQVILSETRIARLRVSSLDPTEISDRMIELMETYENFCPHFHVSLQHVSSKILKLMKRKYSWEHVEATLLKISMMKRKAFVGMDFITGFPGETESDFEESVSRLKDLPWSRLHVFPYSERTGTPATKLPGVVPMPVRKERARVLQALSLERMISLHSAKRANFQDATSGLLKGVLLESAVKGPDGTREWVAGYAQDYQRVLIPKNQNLIDLRNHIVDVTISRWTIDRASGEVSWIGEYA